MINVVALGAILALLVSFYYISKLVSKLLESYRDKHLDPIKEIDEFRKGLKAKLPSVTNHFWDIEHYSKPDGHVFEPRTRITLHRTVDEKQIGGDIDFSLKYVGAEKIAFWESSQRVRNTIENTEVEILKWAEELKRDVLLGSLEEGKEIKA